MIAESVFTYFFPFFPFIKAGTPRATRLCNVSEYGEIKLEKAEVGNCEENLETLEMQVCLLAHLTDNWGTLWV